MSVQIMEINTFHIGEFFCFRFPSARLLIVEIEK